MRNKVDREHEYDNSWENLSNRAVCETRLCNLFSQTVCATGNFGEIFGVNTKSVGIVRIVGYIPPLPKFTDRKSKGELAGLRILRGTCRFRGCRRFTDRKENLFLAISCLLVLLFYYVKANNKFPR